MLTSRGLARFLRLSDCFGAGAMQDLEVRRVKSALVFIDDQSPAKGGHAEHPQVLIEVCLDDTGK